MIKGPEYFDIQRSIQIKFALLVKKQQIHPGNANRDGCRLDMAGYNAYPR